MPYTMINFAAVGFDLARLPHGDHVAKVLRTALSIDQRHLPALAAQHPGHMREERWTQLRDANRSSAAALRHDVAALVATGTDQGPDLNPSAYDMLRSLEISPVGNLDALERLIRHDILDWTWQKADGTDDLAIQSETARQAADVLVDSACAAYAASDLTAQTRREMAEPMAKATAALRAEKLLPMPNTIPENVQECLTQLQQCDHQTMAEWREQGSSDHKEVGLWSTAMNQACWAVHISERDRTAALVQLEAVCAFRAAGFTGKEAANGLWNSISGAMHAMVVTDLLNEKDHNVLTRTWRRIMPQK